MTDEIRGPIESERGDFTLFWDKDALLVRVNDYHADSLRLPWSILESLQARAKAGDISPLPAPKAIPDDEDEEDPT